MRFIVDAHLPAGITKIFQELGFEAIHTRNLPDQNATKDPAILIVAAQNGVVISKDWGFYQSYLLRGKPPKLVFVKIGNMRLRDTIALFQRAAPRLVEALKQYDVV